MTQPYYFSLNPFREEDECEISDDVCENSIWKDELWTQIMKTQEYHNDRTENLAPDTYRQWRILIVSRNTSQEAQIKAEDSRDEDASKITKGNWQRLALHGERDYYDTSIMSEYLFWDGAQISLSGWSVLRPNSNYIEFAKSSEK